MPISYPPILINKYLQQKLGTAGFGAVPMFPTYPSDFDISQGFTIEDLIEGGTFLFDGQAAVYDRMFKFRRKPFPHIKCEQLLYYFYALTEQAVENLIEMTQRLYDHLDREDESAQDLNEWIQTQVTTNGDGERVIVDQVSGKEFYPVFFHNIKVYQLEETRDIVDFGTARTFAGNKLIIDYDYHTVGYSDGKYNGTSL
jgi:hypothetical protein